MESRWFLWPGQTLENTYISDRQKALHITSDAWEGIKGHLDKKRLAAEALARERAKEQAMREESQAMVNQWPDSLMNIFRRKEEERIKRIEARQEEKMQTFFEMRKEQEAVRQKYVDEMRQRIYRKTGFPKEIDSALCAAEVIYEREKQIEIKKLIEQKEREIEAGFAAKVKKGVIDEKVENEEKAKKRREKNVEFAKLYLKEVHEKKELEAKKKEKSVAAEIIDDINAAKEIVDIKKARIEEFLEHKDMVERRLQKHRNIVNERRRIDEQEDRDRDEIIVIQRAAKDRIDCLTKKKRKELLDIFAARSIAISGIVPAIEKEKAEHEKRLLDRAEEEKIKEQDKKEQAKIEHVEKLRKERIAEHARIMEKRKKKEASIAEAKKWEMLNRYKVDVYNKEHADERAAEKWQNVLKYRKELQDQMAAKREVLKNEQLNNDVIVKEKRERLEATDKKFFDYADHVKGIIKSRGGRTIIPLEKVVEDYKKINNLPYRVQRPCVEICGKYQSKRKTYSQTSDPNLNKCNWKTLYDE